MANVNSAMIPLGTAAVDFTLTDTVSGLPWQLSNQRGDCATVIAFICNHCPFVKHLNTALVQLGLDYRNKGICLVAISANDATQYPEDGPDAMHRHAVAMQYPFPYLYDETQETARNYHAECTPDFFVFDGSLRLVYRGQFDDSRPGNGITPTGNDIRQALDALLDGKAVNPQQRPSIGCNIKWKKQ